MKSLFFLPCVQLRAGADVLVSRKRARFVTGILCGLCFRMPCGSCGEIRFHQFEFCGCVCKMVAPRLRLGFVFISSVHISDGNRIDRSVSDSHIFVVQLSFIYHLLCVGHPTRVGPWYLETFAPLSLHTRFLATTLGIQKVLKNMKLSYQEGCL